MFYTVFEEQMYTSNHFLKPGLSNICVMSTIYKGAVSYKLDIIICGFLFSCCFFHVKILI